MMHDREKSDPVIVAVKLTNKAGRPAAESVEPRAGAEGNVNQQSTGRAQYRETVSQALKRIRHDARISRSAVTHPRREKLWGGRAEVVAPSSSIRTDGGCPMAQVNDLSRSLRSWRAASASRAVAQLRQNRWQNRYSKFWNGRRYKSNLPFINHSGAISQCMDTDAPQPRCPFCGTPMQFKPSVPSFGAHSALQTFDCRGCQVILTVPPGAEVFEMAGHRPSYGALANIEIYEC
jgi:hypothetical protein